MPRISSVLSISVPPDLARDIDTLAASEYRSRSEMVREAVRQYVLHARWRRLRDKASLLAAGRGLRPHDVERFVDEDRLAHRR